PQRDQRLHNVVEQILQMIDEFGVDMEPRRRYAGDDEFEPPVVDLALVTLDQGRGRWPGVHALASMLVGETSSRTSEDMTRKDKGQRLITAGKILHGPRGSSVVESRAPPGNACFLPADARRAPRLVKFV